jgi:hypothetical protein
VNSVQNFCFLNKRAVKKEFGKPMTSKAFVNCYCTFSPISVLCFRFKLILTSSAYSTKQIYLYRVVTMYVVEQVNVATLI